MKKLLLLALVLCLFVPCVSAEDIDLSGLSFEQLVALKEKINLAIWNSKEWQEVAVPIGLYVVGKDIPAGSWTIKAAAVGFTVVAFGDKLEPNGREIAYSSYYYREEAWSGKESNYKPGKDPLEFTITVKDGDYVQVDYASALFTPYAGQPDLGFK